MSIIARSGAGPLHLAWYAVHVKHLHESVVATALRNKGYEEFLPRYSTRRRWSDRWKELRLPLFPGYLFVKCNLNDEKQSKILTTPGVIRILGCSGAPIQIPDDQVESIRLLTSSNVALGPWPFLTIGQEVTLTEGPLRGLSGLVIRMDSGLRLIVSVTMLQRSVQVSIAREWVIC